MFGIGKKKKKKNLQTLDSASLPLDAPGGASYIKFKPFLTRSSPINSLKMGKKPHVQLENIYVKMYKLKRAHKMNDSPKKYFAYIANHSRLLISLRYCKSNIPQEVFSFWSTARCRFVLTCCCNYPALSNRPA